MQVVSFALSAVYSGTWFLRWATVVVQKQMWRQLGWFSGLICAGSVAGAVAWGAATQVFSFEFEGNAPGINARQQYTLAALTCRWLAAFFIFYPVEFLCFIVSKLIMLGRLTNNVTRSLQVYATQESSEGGGKRGKMANRSLLVIVYRVIAGAVVLCSVGCLVALYVAGAYNLQAAMIFDRAAAACDVQGNDTNSSLAVLTESTAKLNQSGTTTSVQSFLEAIALLLISTAYLVLVPLSVAMLRRAERAGAHALVAVSAKTAKTDASEPKLEAAIAIVDESIQAAAKQRRHLVIACLVVLITFPARAAYDLLYAYSNFMAPGDPACGICDPCQSNQFLIGVWMGYTPEFQPIVVALSSPLPLSVSLWIITSAHAKAYEISVNILRTRFGRAVTRPADATLSG